MVKRGLEVILLSLLAAMWLPGVPDPAVAAPSSGLIGYWAFDGNGNDLSGGGRDLSLFGGVGFAAGLFGQALDLHGNGAQFAERPVDDGIYDFGSSNFSFQAWVNFNTTAGEQVIIEKFQGGGGPGWTGTKLVGNQWHFWATPSAVLYSPVQSIPIGVWHHVLVRRSGNLFDFFYDGVAVASGSDPDPVPDTSFPLLIGRRNVLDGRVFPVDGRIDEVAIWNRALTNDEVGLLWNQGTGASPVPEPGALLLLASGLAGLVLLRSSGRGALRRGRTLCSGPGGIPERSKRTREGNGRLELRLLEDRAISPGHPISELGALPSRVSVGCITKRTTDVRILKKQRHNWRGLLSHLFRVQAERKSSRPARGKEREGQ